MEQQAFSFSRVCQLHRDEVEKKRGADPQNTCALASFPLISAEWPHVSVLPSRKNAVLKTCS